VDGFVDGSAAVLAYLPVSLAVALPFAADAVVSAVGIVVALLQALLVFVAPVLGKVFALHAEVVVAAHRRDIGTAAIVAELAIFAAVEAFVAVAALLADEVVGVVLEGTVVGAVAVFAMVTIGTILALAAKLAEFVGLEAVAAVGAEMLVPFAALGTYFMLAMIVLLAIFAEHAVRAFRVLGACSALRTGMLFVVARHDAIAVRATRIFRFFVAAFFAKATIIANLLAGGFYAIAALTAYPIVVLAAVDAVFAVLQAPLYIVAVAEAEVTFGTMILVHIASFAEAAL
jgi:hypothetical protein